MPQGSLLSPFLFNIYVNDLLENWNACTDRENVLAYADDTAVVFLSKEQLSKIIRTIESWCNTNKMELNRLKSGIIFLENDKLVGHSFEGFPVVKNYKYLGFLINRLLDPTPQLDEVKDRCRKITAALYVLSKKELSVRARRFLHGFLVQPHYRYGAVLLNLMCATKQSAWIDSYLSSSKTFFGCTRTIGHDFDYALWGYLDIISIAKDERKVNEAKWIARCQRQQYIKAPNSAKKKKPDLGFMDWDLISIRKREHNKAYVCKEHPDEKCHINHLVLHLNATVEQKWKIMQLYKKKPLKMDIFMKKAVLDVVRRISVIRGQIKNENGSGEQNGEGILNGNNNSRGNLKDGDMVVTGSRGR